jgi:hypothetical protein
MNRRATFGACRFDRRALTLRTVLILAAFLILLAYMLLVEARRAPQIAPDATPTPYPILSWKMDDLRSIHVTDGSRTTSVERVDEGWQIVEPASASNGSSTADPRTLYFPLLELAGLEARLLVSQEVQDKAVYGLDVPALTITVETLSGERERLYAGRVTVDGTAFYAAVHRRSLQDRAVPKVAVCPALPGRRIGLPISQRKGATMQGRKGRAGFHDSVEKRMRRPIWVSLVPGLQPGIPHSRFTTPLGARSIHQQRPFFNRDGLLAAHQGCRA